MRHVPHGQDRTIVESLQKTEETWWDNRLLDDKRSICGYRYTLTAVPIGNDRKDNYGGPVAQHGFSCFASEASVMMGDNLPLSPVLSKRRLPDHLSDSTLKSTDVGDQPTDI